MECLATVKEMYNVKYKSLLKNSCVAKQELIGIVDFMCSEDIS